MTERSKPPGVPVKRAVADTPSPEEELRDDVALTIRISRELRDVLYAEAKATHRSINSLLTVFAEAGLGATGKWPPKGPEPPKEPAPKGPVPFWKTAKRPKS